MMIDDEYYYQFENEFRGTREEIRMRTSIYLPIIAPLKMIHPERHTVDLGCGRGEFLENLAIDGWNPSGIDTNQRMVEECQKMGLQVVKGDALDYLQKLQDNSVSVVSGIHIIEHINYEQLRALVREAFRVLCPAGMLILETPNPENHIMKSLDFYMDPTHRNPLPPQLMKFMVNESGFNRSIILRMHGPEKPAETELISRKVRWALTANPDYAIIAQKGPIPGDATFPEFDKADSEQVDGLTYMNDAIIKMESEMNGLKNAIAEKLQEYSIANSSWQVEKQSLETLLVEKEDFSRGIEKSLEELKVHKQQLETSLLAAHQKENAAALKRENLEKQLLELEKSLQLGRMEKEKLEGELSRQKSENEKINQSLLVEQKKAARIEKRYQKQQTEVKATLSALETESSRRSQLEKALESARGYETELELRMRVMENEIATLRTEGHHWWRESDHWWHEADHWWHEADEKRLILEGVYNSVSWKLTAPLRALHFRKFLKNTIYHFIQLLRKIPGVTALFDSIYRKYPQLWKNLASRVKETTPVTLPPAPPEPVATVESFNPNSEDEEHFLQLFATEIHKRRADDMEKSP